VVTRLAPIQNSKLSARSVSLTNNATIMIPETDFGQGDRSFLDPPHKIALLPGTMEVKLFQMTHGIRPIVFRGNGSMQPHRVLSPTIDCAMRDRSSIPLHFIYS